MKKGAKSAIPAVFQPVSFKMEKMVNIKIKKLCEDATLPRYAHEGDAGMDIYSLVDETIEAGERKLIPTGIAFEIPQGYEIQVRSKSGLAANNGLFVLNSPGTIDSGYRGEIKVILLNTGEQEYHVRKGEKIAQIILNKVEGIELKVVEELSETARGSGGLGSTGKK